jgi:CheY-like chemotaxis protein
LNEILLAEDAAADAEQVKAVLTQLGVLNPLRWIEDGAEAMRYLRLASEPPTILFLDIGLPRMTGFEILERLRDIPAYDNALRIVFSSLDDIATIKQAYTCGAQTFLNKPIEIEELEAVIKTFPKHWFLREMEKKPSGVADV